MNRIKEKFNELVMSKSKSKLIVIIGFVGVLLILLSEVNLPASSKKAAEVTKTDYAAYVTGLEKELQELISSIDGVGECKVMITLRNTSEGVYAKNTDSSSSDNSKSQRNEYVIYDGENGDTPILLKENFPDVEGVAIVCSGGDNVVVRERITKCVGALFNISSNRISVSKINSKGDSYGRK